MKQCTDERCQNTDPIFELETWECSERVENFDSNVRTKIPIIFVVFFIISYFMHEKGTLMVN